MRIRITSVVCAGCAVGVILTSDLVAWADGPDVIVMEWGQQLGHADVEKRREAAYALSDLGEEIRPALRPLIQALEDRDDQVRAQSIEAIANLGSEAASAVPSLIEMMSGNDRRRYRAQGSLRVAYALGQIGEAAIEPLKAVLESEDDNARWAAVRAYGLMEDKAIPLIPLIVERLADSDERVRQEAADVLGDLGKASAESIVAYLHHEDLNTRLSAIYALSRLGEGAHSIMPEIFDLFENHSEPAVRSQLLGMLARSGYEPQLVVPLLIDALLHNDSIFHDAGVDGLLSVRNAEADVVPVVKILLLSDQAQIRERAADVLARLGSDAVAAVPALIKAIELYGESAEGPRPYSEAIALAGPEGIPAILEATQGIPIEELSQDHWVLWSLTEMGELAVTRLIETGLSDEPPEGVRFVCVETMRHLGWKAREAQSILLSRGAWDSSDRVRASAIGALSQLNVPEREWLSRLQNSLEDDSPDVRAASVAALSRFTDEEHAETILPLLVQALEDPDPTVSYSAVRVLGEFGSAAQVAVPLLTSRLSEESGEDQIYLIQTLGNVGPGASESIDALVGLSSHSDAEVRAAVYESLGKMGSEGASALPRIREGLEDADIMVRPFALKAFASIEEDPEVLIPVLNNALEDERKEMRGPAINALGEMGSKARPLATALATFLDDSDLRSEALEALRQIRPRDVELYVRALENKDPSVRLFACDGLGRMGKDAEEAIPALRIALRDEYDFVRNRAREALKGIDENSGRRRDG